MSYEFLSVEDVLEIHADQLAEFGGGSGVRDRGLLESAVAQPQATFGGQLVHADEFEIAAAYLFHIVSNHPFIDGNKRTGLLAALVFLDLNGCTMWNRSEELYELTMAIAAGGVSKAAVTSRLRELTSAPET